MRGLPWCQAVRALAVEGEVRCEDGLCVVGVEGAEELDPAVAEGDEFFLREAAVVLVVVVLVVIRCWCSENGGEEEGEESEESDMHDGSIGGVWPDGRLRFRDEERKEMGTGGF